MDLFPTQLNLGQPQLRFNMIIYKITNNITNKVYIGMTTKSLSIRKASHKNAAFSSNYPIFNRLYNSMRKHGFENFKFEELCCAFNRETLSDLEKYFINKYNSNNVEYGYNLTDGGEFIFTVSEETKAKRSGINNHNYKKGPNFGKKLTESHKKKLSALKLGNDFGKYKAKSIRCVETGEIFKTINDLRVKFPKGNIYKAISKKTMSNGLHWEFIDKKETTSV